MLTFVILYVGDDKVSKKKYNKTELVGVKCNKPEMEKLKLLREKYQLRDNPKVFRQLLREKRV